MAAPAAVTEAEVLECQAKWANAIASISSVYLEKGDFVAAAGEAASELYGYGHHNVLFKPTKATKHPFRATGAEAMSYFVGAEAMKNDEFKGEDAGFAINGGKGWSKVVFTNHQIDLNGETATAMGSYDFTCATTGDVATVDDMGFMQITDRSKDVIKSGGEWISSIEIENIAVGHPKVELAAVIGAAHPKWDERPVLLLKLKEGETLDKQEHLDFLQGKIAKWWMPDDVVALDEIPLGATGKIDKKLLRERLKDYRLPA